ncbi:MAG: thiamine diphosphokinase [Gemmatimonadetes bacterium]|nr:thiamine diphosphokinase [Gemmatimonadota bacterium]MXY81192.1 thiamine diphosphokinase [Gemmatimonadota bacterium]MYB71893.1 thiamine diphosphokinase [Gemmatimonadota bacterium]
MSGRSALIVGNGEPPSRELFAACAREAELILCADGGANTASAYGYAPDYIVGDLDSVSSQSKAALAANRVVLVDPEGNVGTDGQKVLNHAVALGVTEAVLVGFTGRRTDHLLGNLSLLKTFADRLALRMVDDYCDIRLIDRCIRFRADIGQKISLCPLDGTAEGITTEGLKWALRSENLIPGVRDGISNEVVDNPVEIRVERGDLLLCVQRESASGQIELLD